MFTNNSEFPVPFVVGDEVVLVAPGGVVHDQPAEFVTVPDFSAFPAPVTESVPEPVALETPAEQPHEPESAPDQAEEHAHDD